MVMPNIDEDPVKRAEVLSFRGLPYYFPLKAGSTAIRQPIYILEIAGFKSLIEGANMALGI